jgi:signal transduction histidine kinase
MLHSIRWRLIFSFILVTLLAVAVVGSVSYRIVGNYVQQREIEGLRVNAQAIAKQAHPYLWPVVQRDELSRLVQTAAFLGDFRVKIIDNQDRVIVDSGSPQVGNDLMLVVPFVDLENLSLDSGDLPVFLWNQKWGELIQEFKFPSIHGLPPGASITILQRGGDPLSRGYMIKDWISEGDFHFDIVDIGDDTSRSSTSFEFSIGDMDSPRGYVELSALPDFGSDVLYQVRQALAFGGGGAVLLAGIVGLWISHWLASPLKKLAQTSAQMEAGDLSVRADVKAHGEIGDLAQQFNQMAERLETSFQQLAGERDSLRRFITDASHELRTPITALKNFNALLMEGADDDPKTRTEFLEESQVQIDRLAWITSNLLDLSRLDAGLLALDFIDCDLREIVESVAGSFEPLAAEKDILLRIVSPDTPCIMSCDRARLEMAITNLVDNAIKFTPKGGEIEIGTSGEDGVQVWVRDNGVGIPPEDLPHIFERFYRGRDHSAMGSGLGLAIVKSIVEVHEGRVAVESKEGEGTTITLSWGHA